MLGFRWQCDSAPSGRWGRCCHVGRDSAAPPPLHSIWKRKKKTFCIEGINSRHLVVARNLGFRSNSGFYVEIEHPYRDMTTFFPRKRRLNPASETFCAKKRELDQWSSGKKASYMWFPLQSAAIQPLSPYGSSIVYGDEVVTFEAICKNTAFLCNCAICGASRDCCMKKFDVMQNGSFRHLEMTTFPRERSSPFGFIGL